MSEFADEMIPTNTGSLHFTFMKFFVAFAVVPGRSIAPTSLQIAKVTLKNRHLLFS